MLNLQNRLQAIAPRAAELASRMPAHASGEVLVKLKSQVKPDHFLSGIKSEDSLEFLEVEQFRIPEQMRAAFGGELLRLKLPEGVSAAEGIALLEQDERLNYVTSNDKRFASLAPNDENYSELWGLQKIQAEGAWQHNKGSRNAPIIAVLDTGIDAKHPDLQANLWTNPGEIPGNGIDDDGNGVVDDVHGYDATKETGDPDDDYGHGSHCAGTIAAVGDNERGVVGVNWQAQIMPVKMMSKGEGTVAETIRAVLYATENGAKITSNSYGGPYNQAEYEAFAASPLLHICAAGNEGNDNDVSRYYPERSPIGYPGSFELDNIISVAATGQTDRLAGFSNYGVQTVDLAAPGVKILSTVPGGGYETKSGTSMATPHVAGVAGLIGTEYPDATPDQIKTRLLTNVDQLPSLKGKVLTGGRLNAARALEKDLIAPAAPILREAVAESKAMAFKWTHTADDGVTGDSATFTEIRWKDADGKAMSHRLKAGLPGSEGSARVPLLPHGQDRDLLVDLVQMDNVANESEITRVELKVPAAELAELTWLSDGKWGLVDLPGRAGVWTDSPDSNYANRADSSLTTKPFTLNGVGSELSFDTRYRIEPQSDSVFVEIRELGAQNWKELEEYTSYREWKRETVDLSAYDGKTVELRFRLKTDSVKSDEGIYLDRVRVSGEKERL